MMQQSCAMIWQKTLLKQLCHPVCGKDPMLLLHGFHIGNYSLLLDTGLLAHQSVSLCQVMWSEGSA